MRSSSGHVRWRSPSRGCSPSWEEFALGTADFESVPVLWLVDALGAVIRVLAAYTALPPIDRALNFGSRNAQSTPPLAFPPLLAMRAHRAGAAHTVSLQVRCQKAPESRSRQPSSLRGGAFLLPCSETPAGEGAERMRILIVED